ncbi:hypothetical protein Pcinc_005114 [Petrolisthes cinctipes]|uniref:Uncharacterized protein n=1 Tax=Petrolisthes cinctipes TaxID=88211 RepID=A0AAE1L0V2_PETCI|nr:hypothetical protein Pcinc_005114 [Petrolisthes cinctipes]
MENECYFHWKYNCNDKTKRLINVKAKHIENIIKITKLYKDDLPNRLQSEYDENIKLVLKAHKGCAEKYLHPKELKKALKRQHSEEKAITVSEPPRKRRSEVTRFNYLHDCKFCGVECKVKKDPKNPSRWRSAYVCRQMKKKGHKPLLKEEILEKYKERNDTWACAVMVRVGEAVIDSHAADARYHVDCRTKFMSSRSTTAARKTTQSAQGDAAMSDEGLECNINILKADKTHI